MGALQEPLRLGVARLEDPPADGELPAIGGKALGWAAVPGVDRPLAVPDERLGETPELAQAAAHAPEQVGQLLGEDESAGGRP
jgi:hypothetical protein